MKRGVTASRGFSVIEVVIAMAIGIAAITAVALVAFTDQSTLSSLSVNVEAQEAAASLMESAGSAARSDFNLVNPTTTTGGIYAKTINVELQPDMVSKLVRTEVTSPLNPLIHSGYSSLFTNTENVSAPDTCNSTIVGDWSSPHMVTFSMQTLIGTTTGIYPISDVDVYQDKLYVSVDSTTYKSDPTLFVFDVSDPSAPTLLGKIDNASTTSGLSALRAATDLATHKLYVFGASTGNFTKGQLQIFDMSTPAQPGFPKTYKIPSAYVSSAGNGNSIFYRDGYVYLGLTTASGIDDFNVIDVRDIDNPLWRGGYHVGSTVESVAVKGATAYLATDDSTRELLVLDVSDPTAPSLSGIYNAPGSTGSGYGRSLAILGTQVFLGRTWVLNSGVPEFYMLAATDTAHIYVQASRDVGTSASPYGVYGLLVRDTLAFMLTKAGIGGRLDIFDISNASRISSESLYGSIALPSGFGGRAMDCENNTLYIGSADPSNNGDLSIVTPG